MSFNLDLNKAEKAIFSWKMTKSFHSKICVNIYYQQKFYLNEKLNLYITIFSEKLPNQCKEQTNTKLSAF